ncbi:uncharacterized protein [Clytia hemisphaerica]
MMENQNVDPANQEKENLSRKKKRDAALKTLNELSKRATKQEEALEKLQNLSKKPKKESRRNKNRTITFKTDSFGNRTYPYGGSKRAKNKKDTTSNVNSFQDTFASENEEDTVPYEEATTTNQRLLDVLNIKLLSKHKKKKKNNSKSWSQRVNALEEKWEEYREEIFAAVVRSYNFNGICQSCKMNEIAVKCDECFTKMLCNQCDKQIHETLTLHNRTSIIDGYKRILMPSELIEDNDVSNKGCPTVPLMPTNCQSCNSSKVERLPGDCVAVVTLSGKYYLHLFSLKCEDCQTTTNPFTLDSVIESGFWPSSPVKFSYLFKVGVFSILGHTAKKCSWNIGSSICRSVEYNDGISRKRKYGKNNPYDFLDVI